MDEREARNRAWYHASRLPGHRPPTFDHGFDAGVEFARASEKAVRADERQKTVTEIEYGGLVLSSREARRAVAALISVGHGSPAPRPPDPYAKQLADRLLARRISGLSSTRERADNPDA